MKLGNLCAAPCFAAAGSFEIPTPGCRSDQLRFANENDRDFYAVLLNNHPPQERGKLNPKVAVVGLSPAATQISAFVRSYSRAGDYGAASVNGAFASLASDIIAMFDGLGLSSKLGLAFTDRALALHPDIYVTSLVACASLTTSGRSDAFDPTRYVSASRCITERFLDEMLNSAFERLQVIVILGGHAWDAIGRLRVATGQTVLQRLRSEGKLVLNLPHPSGANREYVQLASLPEDQVPSLEDYVTEYWKRYRAKPPRTGREKQAEVTYKAKRARLWNGVDALRRSIMALEPLA